MRAIARPVRNENFAPIVFVVSAGILARVAIWAVYDGPALAPDTGSYLELARALLTLDFSHYNGWRTPGYSILLLICGSSPPVVWLAQSLMGLLMTVLIYRIVEDCSKSRLAATTAALLHTLALNQLFFEAAVLSEALAGFLVMLSFWASERAAFRGAPVGGTTLAAGINAMATLTRPIYFVGAAVQCCLLAIAAVHGRAKTVTIFLACFLAPVLAWCAFNQATLGYFGLSTVTGLTLTNHSGAIIERAPDEFATLRDIYLKYRAEHIAVFGTHRMTIFDARPEMMARTGLSDAQLSQQLTRMSIRLFREHPADYAKSVAQAWLGFWTVPTPVIQDRFRSPSAFSIVSTIATAEKWIFRAAYAVFLCLALPIAWIALIRNRARDTSWNCAAAMVATVLAVSVIQAFLEYGSAGRYAVPTQSLAMAAIIIAASKIGRQGERRSGEVRGTRVRTRASVGEAGP
jgi:uncharacterized membrane protein YhaH (DUF805 family)